VNRNRRALYAVAVGAVASICLASGDYLSALAVAVVACLLALPVLARPRREVTPMHRHVMPPLPAPPQRYRLHLLDGQYELLRDRLHLVELDLGGPGVDAALARHLSALVIHANAACEIVQYPRLEVHDPDTGVLLLSWTGA
jgi:hypothetical protein